MKLLKVACCISASEVLSLKMEPACVHHFDQQNFGASDSIDESYHDVDNHNYDFAAETHTQHEGNFERMYGARLSGRVENRRPRRVFVGEAGVQQKKHEHLFFYCARCIHVGQNSSAFKSLILYKVDFDDFGMGVTEVVRRAPRVEEVGRSGENAADNADDDAASMEYQTLSRESMVCVSGDEISARNGVESKESGMEHSNPHGISGDADISSEASSSDSDFNPASFRERSAWRQRWFSTEPWSSSPSHSPERSVERVPIRVVNGQPTSHHQPANEQQACGFFDGIKSFLSAVLNPTSMCGDACDCEVDSSSSDDELLSCCSCSTPVRHRSRHFRPVNRVGRDDGQDVYEMPDSGDNVNKK